MADPLEHAAHLTIAAFVQRKIDDGAIARNGDDAQHRGRRSAAFEKDAAAQFFDGFGFEAPAQRRAIDFVDAETRVREREREIAVVRQQQHAGRIVIEPSDRHQPRRLRSALRACKIVDRSTPLGVVHRRYDPDGFVQDQHFALRHHDRAPVDVDAIAVVDSRAELADELTVDTHLAGDDQLFGRAAGRNAGKREKALESHGESATRPLSHLLPRA